MPLFLLNITDTTYTYTLSLHDALPISRRAALKGLGTAVALPLLEGMTLATADVPKAKPIRAAFMYVPNGDRKSTRLNSSHTVSSYAVFCLKKKNKHRSSETTTG